MAGLSTLTRALVQGNSTFQIPQDTWRVSFRNQEACWGGSGNQAADRLYQWTIWWPHGFTAAHRAFQIARTVASGELHGWLARMPEACVTPRGISKSVCSSLAMAKSVNIRATHALPIQFDLSEDKPVSVLRTLWSNLKAREMQGDKVAQHIRKYVHW